MRNYYNIVPEKKAYLWAILKMKALFWAKGLILYAGTDEILQKEAEGFPENFSFDICVYPSRTLVKLYKAHNGLYLSDDSGQGNTDVSLLFKSLHGAKEVLSGKLKCIQAMNEKRFILCGRQESALSVVRFISRYEGLFFLRGVFMKQQQKHAMLSPFKAYRTILLSRDLGREVSSVDSKIL